MRLISWNIQQGGGKRAERIIEQLGEWNPDVVGLSEFNATDASLSISRTLQERGLSHQITTADPAGRGTPRLLLASRFPMSDCSLLDHGRIVTARLTNENLFVAALYVPPQSRENKLERSKILADAVERLEKRSQSDGLAFGDTNNWIPPQDGVRSQLTAEDISWFEQLKEAGWSDLWRHHNPDTTDYTWWANSASGFRCDQVFGTAAIRDRVQVQYDWGAGERGALSDHAAIVIDVD